MVFKSVALMHQEIGQSISHDLKHLSYCRSRLYAKGREDDAAGINSSTSRLPSTVHWYKMYRYKVNHKPFLFPINSEVIQIEIIASNKQNPADWLNLLLRLKRRTRSMLEGKEK
jgi:hypothetical protein